MLGLKRVCISGSKHPHFRLETHGPLSVGSLSVALDQAHVQLLDDLVVRGSNPDRRSWHATGGASGLVGSAAEASAALFAAFGP